MKTYHVNHILPQKAAILFLLSFIPFAVLTIYLEEVHQWGKLVAGIPMILGFVLGSYFLGFFTEGVKVVQLSGEEIIIENTSVKLVDIKSFKLKDDSPEFIYLRIVTHANRKYTLGTRKSSQDELLKLHSDLKGFASKHNQTNATQIQEKRLIYDTLIGKLVGIILIGLIFYMSYEFFFATEGTKSYGPLISFTSLSIFLLYRIFGKKAK